MPEEPAALPRRTRLAAYAVVIADEQLLLTRLTSDGVRWTLPGGGVDFGEHPADTARREVREETGLEVELNELLGVDSLLLPAFAPAGYEAADWHSVRIVWTATVVGGSLRDEVGGSTDRAAWVPLGDVPALPSVELLDRVLDWL